MKTNGFILIKLLALLGHLSLVLSASYDFFYFVQTWPGSFHCVPKHNCTGQFKAAENFGIHGLWPMRNDGTYPKDCNPGNPLKIKNIANLVPKLKKEWPALTCTCYKGLEEYWSHEWAKHGTCSEQVLAQNPYFSATLKLKTKTDILNTLKSEGIKPDGRLYNLNGIKKALKRKVGVNPRVTCNEDQKTKGVFQLYQIFFCVDHKGQNFIECPINKGDTNCKQSIKFPVYKKRNEIITQFLNILEQYI